MNVTKMLSNQIVNIETRGFSNKTRGEMTCFGLAMYKMARILTSLVKECTLL